MTQIVHIEGLRLSRSLHFGLRIPKLTASTKTILCIVGPNGSGKTTLIECLAGLLTPDRGTVCIDGQPISNDLRTTKRILGFIPDDEDWLIPELCAREYFALLAGIYRQAGCITDIKLRASTLAKDLQFTAFEQQLRHLSHGNKKKVQIVASLMHQPKILIVDEIRNGLDPLAILTVESLLKQEVERGMTLVAATHDLWWAERVADEILLLLDGAVSVHQKKQALIQRHGSLENLFVHAVRRAGLRHAV